MAHETTSHDTTSRRAFLRNSGIAATAALAAARGRAFGQTPAGANDRIGIGMIGVGGRGSYHLESLKHLKETGANIEFVAVCDAYRPRMQRAVDRYGAKGYMDHRELLADPNVDAVFVATPDHIHGYQAIDAVHAGKDVYCEKPVTHWRQFDLTRRLAEEVKKSGRVFQLGTQALSDSAWRQMRALVKDGIIGKPLHAECGYFRVGDWGERGMPVDDPHAKPGPDLNWEAFLGDAPQRKFDVSRFFRWRMYEDYAGGPVTDLYPHCLSNVTHILDAGFPSAVVATGGKFRYQEREVPDTFNMIIDYPENYSIIVMGTQGNNFAGTGERGSAQRIPVVRGWEGTLTVVEEEIVFTPAEGSKREAQRFPVERGENLIYHQQNFLDACRDRNIETWSPVDLAYRTQTALIMGMQAFHEGKTIRFNPDKEKIVA